MNAEIFEAEPYTGKYSNCGDKNIFCSVLMPPSPLLGQDDTNEIPKKFDPIFVRKSAPEFIEKPLTYEHNMFGRYVIGKCLDVVYNFNGFYSPSGKFVEADDKIWIIYEVYPDELTKVGLSIEDVDSYGVSTDYQNIQYKLIEADHVYGFKLAKGCYQEITGGTPTELTLTTRPRIDDCSVSLNSFSEKNKNNFDLQQNGTIHSNGVNNIVMSEGTETESKNQNNNQIIEEKIDKLLEAVNALCSKNSTDGQDDDKKGESKNSDGEKTLMGELENKVSALENELQEIKAKLDKLLKEEDGENDDKKDNEPTSNVLEVLDSSLNGYKIPSQSKGSGQGNDSLDKCPWEC